MKKFFKGLFKAIGYIILFAISSIVVLLANNPIIQLFLNDIIQKIIGLF